MSMLVLLLFVCLQSGMENIISEIFQVAKPVKICIERAIIEIYHPFDGMYHGSQRKQPFYNSLKNYKGKAA